ncbi:hypothetical protein [Nocardia sp. NPDC004750]
MFVKRLRRGEVSEPELVRGGDLFLVEFDAESGARRQGEQTVGDTVGIPGMRWPSCQISMDVEGGA